MIRAIALACSLSGAWLCAGDEKEPPHPFFDYGVARAHEIRPHRRSIGIADAVPVSHQLRLVLTVSPAGDVLEAKADGDPESLSFWPQLNAQVREWKFIPFEQNGRPVTARVEEYVNLVARERRPATHVDAPKLGPDSEIAITLKRTECYGSCPSYTVRLTTKGLLFDGRAFVLAPGKHTESVDADAVRKLAKAFIAADFYSMDESYRATVTDNPTAILSLSIDGHTKTVTDYVGEWVGMPEVITELEEDVDTLARTGRWIDGDDGLVQALQAEKFNFRTFEAQVMLKEAASRGQMVTVQKLLLAGLPLDPLPAPKPLQPDTAFRDVGWLNAASAHPDTLELLIRAGASRNDQSDKDQALAGAARAGGVAAVRALIAYGANPNVDLGVGSVLINAAQAGNPEVVREILLYHPKLEGRDREGRTALFAAGAWTPANNEDPRVECVRLLVKAGANVNARDNQGNTPLHEASFTRVDEELLKLGADVNARNNDGETPIFTALNDDAIPLFIAHGADLTIRNNKGETVLEAAETHGPGRQEALRKAMQQPGPR